MRPRDWIRFIVLCSIWGLSFGFIRICAPVVGPVLTSAARMGIAGIALAAYLRLIGFDAKCRENWVAYLRVGLLASAVPFVCFATGAL